MIRTINNGITERLIVADSLGSPVEGLLDGDFNKTLLREKIATAEALTISEMGSGFYYVDFTPVNTGYYEWTISHDTYKPKGWWEYYDVGIANTDDIKTVVDSNASELTTQNIILARLLGLVQENFYIDTTVYDANSNLTSARMRTYTDAVSVGTDSNVQATYVITSTYNAQGQLLTYAVDKQ